MRCINYTKVIHFLFNIKGFIMHNANSNILMLIGRIFLALIFLMAGFDKLSNFSGTAAMINEGIPMVNLLLIISIIIEIGAGLMVLLGLWAKLGALLLFLFTIPATYYFHDFWGMEGQAMTINMMMFMKNLAMMGGLLYIMAHGPGKYSLSHIGKNS